jgi:peptidoglycan/LPS O-acetylase OafA/YrhL
MGYREPPGTSSPDGRYAGCAWFVVAAVLGVGAYWGLGIAGPSALPTVILILAAAAGSVALATALLTGRGGRKLAVLSLILGVILAALPFVTGSDETTIETRFGSALFGVAVVLASAFAARGHR